MTDHPIELMLAIGAGVAVILIGYFLRDRSTAQETVPSTKAVSLQMTSVELRKLCQLHRINNAKWRNRAIKTEMVRALYANGVTRI